MKVVKDVCYFLIGVGIIIAYVITFVSAIAEGDPRAWVIPVGVAIGLLSLWLAKVGRDHPSGRPYKAVPCYRVYAYVMVTISMIVVGSILYVIIDNDIVSMPLGALVLALTGIAIELIIIFAFNLFEPVRKHDNFDKELKVLREMKEEKSKIDAPYDMIAFDLEKVRRIQKEHLDKEVINAMHMRDGLIHLHTRFCKRSRRK